MKREIVFLKKNWLELIQYFSLDTENESGAVALAKLVKDQQLMRFLVRELIIPADKDYLERSPTSVSFTPEFMERMFKGCEQKGFHLINIHNHPFSDTGSFSLVDDTEDQNTKGPYVQKWVPGVEQAFVVMGKNPERLDARHWTPGSERLTHVDLFKVI